jgi:hypothetical protein
MDLNDAVVKYMPEFVVYRVDEDGQEHSTENSYLVVDVDEDYADKVFDLIKKSEIKKGTDNLPKTFNELAKAIKIRALATRFVNRLYSSAIITRSQAFKMVRDFEEMFSILIEEDKKNGKEK